MLRGESALAPGQVHAERADNQLVEMTVAGDEAAFECLFDRHKRRVALIAARFFNEHADIEDVIQITFTKAYFELGNFRGVHELSLASWLKRITANACLNKLKAANARKRGIAASLSDFEMETLAADPACVSAEDLSVQRDLLAKLLATLSPDDQVLLKMLHSQEMSVAEIAGAFGWSAAKVKVRAFRARRSLNRMVRKLM